MYRIVLGCVEWLQAGDTITPVRAIEIVDRIRRKYPESAPELAVSLYGIRLEVRSKGGAVVVRYTYDNQGVACAWQRKPGEYVLEASMPIESTKWQRPACAEDIAKYRKLEASYQQAMEKRRAEQRKRAGERYAVIEQQKRSRYTRVWGCFIKEKKGAKMGAKVRNRTEANSER